MTAADLINMATFGRGGEPWYTPEYEMRSPDGRLFAVVVHRGNLVRNTVDYAVLVFSTAHLLRSPKPDTVVTFASSSNRPAIQRVRWLSDNRTLLVLGEQPGELPQVYSVDTRNRTRTQLTHATTAIETFDTTPTGNPLVYAAEVLDTAAYPSMRAHGFVVSRQTNLGDLALGILEYHSREARSLHVVRNGRETNVPLPHVARGDNPAGYRRCLPFGSGLRVAPSGDRALVECFPSRNPAWWSAYRFHDFNVSPFANHYVDVVVDLETGRAHALTEAPQAVTLWAPDGRTVVLSDAMLPLNIPDSAERAARVSGRALAAVDVETGAVSVISRQGSLTALGWDAANGALEVRAEDQGSPWQTRRLYFHKTPSGGWVSRPGEVAASIDAPHLIIEDGLNTPPQLVTIDPRTQQRRVVYDPNPGLLVAHRFGRETVVHWQTKAGQAWVGGLYWPPDYTRGRRYPLVIQTHEFDSTHFMPKGIGTSGYAAQPLASLGVMVLQMGELPDDADHTRGEGPLNMEAMESAIDALDSLGLIDRTKVGLQGFSRTCYHVLYFLTHSRYPAAAATVTEGPDYSYFQRMALAALDNDDATRDSAGSDSARNRKPRWLEEYDAINGGPPFGTSLASWGTRAPGFNLHHVTAPLLLTALGGGPAEEWEPYVGLMLQGKPTELVYIPDGDHELVKPWEQLTSQQGAVDWYRFWLKGEEDPDPAKREQYTRWRALRRLQQASLAKVSTNQQH